MFPALKTVELFSVWPGAEILLPEYTMGEITAKIAGIFQHKNKEICETRIEEPKLQLLSESIESESDLNGDDIYDEVVDDPLEMEINIATDKLKEDPTYERKPLKGIIHTQENEIEAGFNFPIEFDLQVANDKFNALMEDVKSKSEKTMVNGKERYQCSLCGEICAQLTIHVGRNHAEQNFKCSQCPVAVGSANLLKLHEKVHLSKPVPCKICGKHVKDINNHMLQKHEATKYGNIKCTECPKVFVKNGEFRRHFNNVHLQLKEPCPICQKEMLPNKINSHVKMVHQKLKNHFCPSCGKGFFDRRDMERHVSRIHLEEKELCVECGKELSAGQLKKHIANCHSEVDNRVVCPECGKKVGSLLEHVNSVHKKLRNYQCPICPLRCYKKNTLNRHLEWHEKGQCTVDGKQKKTRMRKEMKEEIARNMQVDVKDLPSVNPFIHIK